MSLDTILERLASAYERQADAMELIAANLGGVSKPKNPVGRPKKAETIEGAPAAGEALASQGAAGGGSNTAALKQPATVTPASPNVAAVATGEVAKTASAMPVVNVTNGAAGIAMPLADFQAIVGRVCVAGKAAQVSAIFKKYGTDRASQVPEVDRAAAAAEIIALAPETA